MTPCHNAWTVPVRVRAPEWSGCTRPARSTTTRWFPPRLSSAVSGNVCPGGDPAQVLVGGVDHRGISPDVWRRIAASRPSRRAADLRACRGWRAASSRSAPRCLQGSPALARTTGGGPWSRRVKGHHGGHAAYLGSCLMRRVAHRSQACRPPIDRGRATEVPSARIPDAVPESSGSSVEREAQSGGEPD